MLHNSNRTVSGIAPFLQETSQGEEEVEVPPFTQQMSFDLGRLRAAFKRKWEDAGAVHEPSQPSKKGQFEAASLQVQASLCCVVAVPVPSVLPD